jgi:hypothetical protein
METFGRFLAYYQHFKAIYPKNIANLNLDPNSNCFKTAFFSPAVTGLGVSREGTLVEWSHIENSQLRREEELAGGQLS